MATRLFISIMEISSKLSRTKKSFTTSLRPKPYNLPSQTPCKSSSSRTINLRSICQMEWNKSSSPMARSSPFIKTARKRAFLLMVQSRKSTNRDTKQLNILMEIETYFCQMVLAPPNELINHSIFSRGNAAKLNLFNVGNLIAILSGIQSNQICFVNNNNVAILNL